jgi:hypothetical protein
MMELGMTRQELQAARARDVEADRRIIPVADNAAAQRDDDTGERRRALDNIIQDDEASLAAIAFLLGAPRSHYGDKNSTIARRLLIEIIEGRLQTADDLKFTGGVHPEIRRNPTTVSIARAEFRAWLASDAATDADRASLAATWARGA